jgi:hypothetical protein
MSKRGKTPKRRPFISPPVIVCPDTLPLLDTQISWNRFEGFIRQLVCLLPGVRDVKRYGKSGSKQRGIDLIATLESGERWVFQCKQCSSFKLDDAKKAIGKTTYLANKYFLVIACQTDSTVHDYIDTQRNWELWDGERVSDEVLKLPRDAARALVTRCFGPGWCRAFLGFGSTSPFFPWKPFFERWSKPDRLFNHSWQLVGRADFVSALDQFSRDKQKRVALLIGRGGIGKSKLLHAFAKESSAKSSNRQLWFVEENIPLTQQSIDELPDTPCVIVVDDAHRSENLKPLLAAAVHSGSQKKLLLSTRPQRLDFLKAELTRAGFDYTEVVQLPELKHLSRDEVKALARQALGSKLAHLDRRLADATWDCPLVTVVGGKLLATASLDPQLLESHDGFRAEVLNRFQDIIVGRIAEGQDAVFYSELLQVLSATAPFPIEQSQFVKAAADFLKRTAEEVVKGVAELERAGVLLRRGRLLRVTPDVLADHILHQACVTAGGQPTGYAERVFITFVNVRPEKVFLNLAELDWRVLVSARSSTLLVTIWKQLENLLRTSTPEKKSWVMGLVKEVAYYQPEQALQMVELALKHLPAPINRKPSWFVMSWRDHMLQSLPEILRRIAHTLEFAPRAARLLWELGRGDGRQLNQYPEHAFRLLTELAAYTREKPLSFYQVMLDTVVAWLNEPDIHTHKHSLLDVLDRFLVKVAEWTESEGMQISWGRFPVSREKTAHLREKAFKAICSCAVTGDQRVILRVLKSIQSVLHSGLQFDLGKISQAEIRQWQPDQLAAVAAVERIIQQTTDPVIHHQCLNVLRDRPRSEHSTKVRQEANRVAKLVRDSFELRLVQALARSDDFSWMKRHADINMARKMHEEELKKFHERVSREFQDKHPSAKLGLQVLDGLISQLRVADITLYETPFLLDFAAYAPAYTNALCVAINARPSSELSRVFHIFLNAIEAVQPCTVLPHVRKAVAGRNETLCWAAASHLDWMARQRGLSKEELILLNQLLKYSNVSVASNALSAVRWIGRKNPREGVRLLLHAKWERDTRLASAALSCIDGQYGIPPDKLSAGEFRIILKRLEQTPNIENWEISQFLEHAATRCPDGVVRLLVNRIRKSVKRKLDFDERPIPDEFHHPLPDLSKHPRGADLLRQIRDMTLKRPWQYSHFGRDLYWLLAPFDYCLNMLNEWIESADDSRFKAALALLTEIESDYIFRRPDYVEYVLTKAQKHSVERFEKAKSALFFCAIRHGESRAVGQPGPTTIATKDRAAELVKKYPTGSLMANFYQAVVKQSEARLADEKLRDEELLDGE